MKKYIPRFLVLSLVTVLFLAGSFSVSAVKYKSNIVKDDFSSSSDSLFVCPGDVDYNGELNAGDLTSIISTILTSEGTSYSSIVANKPAAKYSDVNGDGYINIIDLIRIKKNIADNNFFKSGGTMSFYGKCVYSKSLTNDLATGASYKISYKYKAEAPLTVKLNLIGEEKTYNNSVSSEWQTVEYTVSSQLSKGSAADFDLVISGKGVLDNFSITRINMDNEMTAP